MGPLLALPGFNRGEHAGWAALLALPQEVHPVGINGTRRAIMRELKFEELETVVGGTGYGHHDDDHGRRKGHGREDHRDDDHRHGRGYDRDDDHDDEKGHGHHDNSDHGYY